MKRNGPGIPWKLIGLSVGLAAGSFFLAPPSQRQPAGAKPTSVAQSSRPPGLYVEAPSDQGALWRIWRNAAHGMP